MCANLPQNAFKVTVTIPWCLMLSAELSLVAKVGFLTFARWRRFWHTANLYWAMWNHWQWTAHTVERKWLIVLAVSGGWRRWRWWSVSDRQRWGCRTVVQSADIAVRLHTADRGHSLLTVTTWLYSLDTACLHTTDRGPSAQFYGYKGYAYTHFLKWGVLYTPLSSATWGHFWAEIVQLCMAGRALPRTRWETYSTPRDPLDRLRALLLLDFP